MRNITFVYTSTTCCAYRILFLDSYAAFLLTTCFEQFSGDFTEFLSTNGLGTRLAARRRGPLRASVPEVCINVYKMSYTRAPPILLMIFPGFAVRPDFFASLLATQTLRESRICATLINGREILLWSEGREACVRGHW